MTTQTAAHARDLAQMLQTVGKQRVLTAPDIELVEQLWSTWCSSDGKHARRYLMHLIRLAKKSAKDKRAAGELSRCLAPKALRVHMPGMKRSVTGTQVRREVTRFVPIEPLHRGRPPKGAPKPRFYRELVKTLRRLGIERVTERQLMRDYWEVGRR